MLRLFARLAILLLSVIVLGGAFQQDARSLAGIAAIDRLTANLDRIVPASMARSSTPGAALAVVQDGELVWSETYGWADVAGGRRITTESLFQVASISKTAVAWGVMALVETGQVALDVPIDRYLRRWHLPPSEFDANEVTVRRVLSHSAGLNTPEYLGYLPGQPRPDLVQVLADGDGRAPGVRLEAEPGTRFAYSDGGYLLLQLLIEDVSGVPFDVYMQRTVFNPLGLPEATFTVTPERAARLVTSYDPYGKPYPRYEFVELAPAGLMISAPDLARLVAAAMTGPKGEPPGRGVLSPASIDDMLTPQIDLRFPENWIYARQYGLGVFIDQPQSGTLISHMGGNLNGVTEYMARPATGDAIVVLTTSIAGHEVFADAVAAWTDWLGSGAATLPHAIRVSRSILRVVAIGLALVGLVLADALVRAYRRGQRTLLRGDPRPAWLRVLRFAAPLLALGTYMLWLDPWMRISMPSVATTMAIGVAALLLSLWGWLISWA